MAFCNCQPVWLLAPQPAAQDFLGGALAVNVGGVDEIAPGLGEAVEDLYAFLFAGLAPEGHGPQAAFAYPRAGFAHVAVIHAGFLSGAYRRGPARGGPVAQWQGCPVAQWQA